MEQLWEFGFQWFYTVQNNHQNSKFLHKHNSSSAKNIRNQLERKVHKCGTYVPVNSYKFRTLVPVPIYRNNKEANVHRTHSNFIPIIKKIRQQKQNSSSEMLNQLRIKRNRIVELYSSTKISELIGNKVYRTDLEFGYGHNNNNNTNSSPNKQNQ